MSQRLLGSCLPGGAGSTCYALFSHLAALQETHPRRQFGIEIAPRIVAIMAPVVADHECCQQRGRPRHLKLIAVAFPVARLAWRGGQRQTGAPGTLDPGRFCRKSVESLFVK
jgi:hypothetical protein